MQAAGACLAGRMAEGRLVGNLGPAQLSWRIHTAPIYHSAVPAGPHLLLRQHVLRGVAKLVEQRLHLAEGHEGGLAAHGWRLVAHHVRHGQPHRLARPRKQLGLAAHLVHPAGEPWRQVHQGRAWVAGEQAGGQGWHRGGHWQGKGYARATACTEPAHSHQAPPRFSAGRE